MTTARRGSWARAGLLATLVVAAVCGLASGTPAAAGGADWITPARDRYEPGQSVVMIGYGDAGPDWREKGPFHAYLRVDPVVANSALTAPDAPLVHPTDLRVATVVVEELDPVVGASWWTHRASITFDLPAGVPPAVYDIVVCAEPCEAGSGLGGFWPEPIFVGVDPPQPVVRSWPLTEPGIRWLEDDALVAPASGQEVTAADIRAGRITPPAPAEVLPDAPEPDAADPVAAADLPAVTAGPTATAAPAATNDDADDAADRTWAWWIAGEIAVLVGGCAAARWWIGHRRRRRGGGDGGSPAPKPRPPSSEPQLVYEPDPEDASPDGPLRRPVRIRL
jgi:hypothetical protein